MDYELLKLKEEYTALVSIWNKLKLSWTDSLNQDDLYKVYPYLTTTAAIARKRIYWNNELDYVVKVIVPTDENNIDLSQYFYYDERAFFNGEKIDLALSKICGLFLHQKEYCYMDNRKSDGKMSPSVSIYVYVKTDVICKSCALSNGIDFKENTNNYRLKNKGYVTLTDCTCGYYVDIESYLRSLKKVIDCSSKSKKLLNQ